MADIQTMTDQELRFRLSNAEAKMIRYQTSRTLPGMAGKGKSENEVEMEKYKADLQSELDFRAAPKQ